MTKDQLIKRVKQYDQLLAENHFEPQRKIETNNVRDLDHLRWMLQQILELLEEEKIEKAHRWYGFAQGVLWLKHIYSISELREHNCALQITKEDTMEKNEKTKAPPLFHTHPKMEQRFGLDSDHVIVDRNVFLIVHAALLSDEKPKVRLVPISLG
jgi:hypothetical protein